MHAHSVQAVHCVLAVRNDCGFLHYVLRSIVCSDPEQLQRASCRYESLHLAATVEHTKFSSNNLHRAFVRGMASLHETTAAEDLAGNCPAWQSTACDVNIV